MLRTRPSDSWPTFRDPERRPPHHLSGPLGSAVGFGAAIAATIVAWLLGAGSAPLVGLVLLGAAAAVVGAFTTVPGALATAVQCWALYDGFIAHRLGELSFATADLTALAVVLAAGTAGVAVGRLMLGAVLVSPREQSGAAGFPGNGRHVSDIGHHVPAGVPIRGSGT